MQAFVPSNTPEVVYTSPTTVGLLVANYAAVSDVYLAESPAELSQVDVNGVPLFGAAVLLAKSATTPLQFPTFKGTLWGRAATAPGTLVTVVPNQSG